MLHAAGNDMIAGSQKPVQAYIDGFRYIGGKDDPQRVGGVKEFCQGLTGIINNPPGLYSQPVPGAARIGPHPL